MEGAGERAVPSVTQRGWKERPSGLGRAAPLLRVSPASSGKSGGLSQVLPGVASSSTVLFFSVRTPLLMNRFLLFFKKKGFLSAGVGGILCFSVPRCRGS